jgi:hypothetical protein
LDAREHHSRHAMRSQEAMREASAAMAGRGRLHRHCAMTAEQSNCPRATRIEAGTAAMEAIRRDAMNQ